MTLYKPVTKLNKSASTNASYYYFEAMARCLNSCLILRLLS